MNNSLLSGAIIAVRANIYNTIEKSRWMQGRMREDAYRQLKALNSVINSLEREIQTGKLARKQLNMENRGK